MKVNLRIPTTLNDVTLAQYQEFAKLESKLDQTNDAAIQLKIVEIFCDVPEIVVRNMKATDIADICEIINRMFDAQHQLINRFKHKGVEYGFIPELDDMSFGEYMDLDTFIGDNDNLHRAVNVLFRPIEHKRGHRYKIKDYDPDTSEEAKEFPLDVVLGAIVFFYNLGKDLSMVMLNSLDKKNEKALAQHLLSQPNGDGLTHSMEYLTEILQNLKISLN